MKEWDPDKAFETLELEASFADEETEVAQAERIFRENLVLSSAAICHLANYASNERIRLDAAKYVVERNIGRLNDVNPFEKEDVFAKLMAEVTKEATK